MTRRGGRGVLAALLCAPLLMASDAAAQSGGLLPGRVEVGLSGVGQGALDLGDTDADQTTPQGGTTALFETSTRLQPAIGFEAHVGVGLSRRLQLDGHAAYARSDLRTRITNDREGISDLTLAESIKRIAMGGALTVHFPGWSAASRAVPFVSIGGSYRRDLHDGDTLVEEGYSARFGGGLKYLFGGGTLTRPTGVGLRAEVRAELGRGGVAFDDDPKLTPAAAIGLFFRF